MHWKHLVHTSNHLLPSSQSPRRVCQYQRCQMKKNSNITRNSGFFGTIMGAVIYFVPQITLHRTSHKVKKCGLAPFQLSTSTTRQQQRLPLPHPASKTLQCPLWRGGLNALFAVKVLLAGSDSENARTSIKELSLMFVEDYVVALSGIWCVCWVNRADDQPSSAAAFSSKVYFVRHCRPVEVRYKQCKHWWVSSFAAWICWPSDIVRCWYCVRISHATRSTVVDRSRRNFTHQFGDNCLDACCAKAIKCGGSPIQRPL